MGRHAFGTWASTPTQQGAPEVEFAALGRTQWLYDSIRAATAGGHRVTLIGTARAAPESAVTEEDFARLADELHCPFFCDPAINRPERVRMARESGADVAMSVNWPTLLGREMLDQFKHGVVNSHAGDLPRFRGNATPNWAILNGEDKIVLTLHRMVESLDAGPILAQRDFPLTPSTYIAEVYRFLSENVPALFLKVLDELDDGRSVAHEQPSSPALSLRCFPREPVDGELDWSRPAVELGRLVRATAEPFAGAYTFLGTQRVTVWRARPEVLPYPYLGVPGQVVEIRRDTGEVAVLTPDGVLVLERVELASGGRRLATEVVQSTRQRFGMNLSNEVAQLRAQVKVLTERVAAYEQGGPA